MDKQKAIRAIMAQATETICAICNLSGDEVHPSDLKITENITEALRKEGVTEADIEAALKG